MSTTTSVFGLLPLVLATGSGSELYRGLGSVILGGLALSTVLTLFVIPALLVFLIKLERPPAAAAAGPQSPAADVNLEQWRAAEKARLSATR